MRKRDSSEAGGRGRRKPPGRSGGPSNRSRSGSSDSRNKKPFSRSRDDRDDSKPPRGGKSFGRSKDKSFGSSSRGEKPFSRSRDDRDDSKPSRPSKFSRDKDADFSKSPRGGKSFGRSKDKSFGSSSRGDKPFSRSRDDRNDSRPPRGEGKSFDRSDKPTDKKGFFSKLSRGGKSFERRQDPDFGKSVKDFSEQKEEKKDQGSEKIRLNRYISNSGVCSRREADELITMGLVSVNGTVITEMGHKVNRTDVVKYDGKTLRAEKPVYILLNKPKGFLTTTKDPQDRNTVMQIIAGAVKERVYPVGRLDRNTTGLLLLTNDGELTDKLSHPSYNVKKIYKAELDKPLTKTDFQKILDGVQLEEGRAMVDDLAIVSDDGKTVGIEIHIGWNRVIRRIFERLEYEVLKLDRSVYAGLDKKLLSRGHWRFLTKEEIVRLKHYK
jgi:23S rRNA pseudouridine2605 synthase